MLQSIVHIALVVRDYDEAIDFYTNRLHFTLIEDSYQPEQDKRWVVVTPPGSHGTTVLLARLPSRSRRHLSGTRPADVFSSFWVPMISGGTTGRCRSGESALSGSPKRRTMAPWQSLRICMATGWDLIQFRESHPMFQRVR